MQAQLTIRHGHLDSPIGRLLVVATGEALSGLWIADHERAPAPPPGSVEGGATVDRVHDQLAGYFAGTRVDFDLPLALEGTPFQREVWRALLDVPYGATASYRDIAVRIGRPRAVRAVGAANGANPISIVVPCHRVVGQDGSLTGYGWGTARKRWLLDHEQVAAGPAPGRLL